MSLSLRIGVLLLPWVFCWATVRRKHTPWARVVSFGWAMATLVTCSSSAAHRAGIERASSAMAAVAAHERESNPSCGSGADAPRPPMEHAPR